jgi:hypothetical protein
VSHNWILQRHSSNLGFTHLKLVKKKLKKKNINRKTNNEGDTYIKQCFYVPLLYYKTANPFVNCKISNLLRIIICLKSVIDYRWLKRRLSES